MLSYHTFFVFPRELFVNMPAGAVAKYCDKYICVCVCEAIPGTTCAIFTKFFVHVAYGRGSVLL